MKLTTREKTRVLSSTQGYRTLGPKPDIPSDKGKASSQDKRSQRKHPPRGKEVAQNPYTVIGLYPDSDWGSCMFDATFVEWVTAPSPIEAARIARHQMARVRLSGSDEPADDDIEKEVPEAAQDFAVLCVFSGHHEDLYESWHDKEHLATGDPLAPPRSKSSRTKRRRR